MDINTVCVSGKISNIGVNETNGDYPIVEARLRVNVGSKGDVVNYDTFNIRSYGKKSLFIASLSEGDFVVVEGRLKEDLRVNALNPATVRSKTYINIDRIKAFNGNLCNTQNSLGD